MCFWVIILFHGLLIVRLLFLTPVPRLNIVGLRMLLLKPPRYVIFYFELHCPLKWATPVYYDNISVVYMSHNPVQHQRTKHVEMDIHFVREKVALGHIRVLHVPSSSQFADIFTKGLPQPLFTDFRSSLSICPPPAPTVGVY